jgi:HK97 family phage portal protein
MPFVVSQGQVRTLAHQQPMMRTSIQLAEGLTQAYGEIFRKQPSVRTVVTFLGRNIAGLKLQTFRRVSDTDRERITDHPIARLLAQPAPGSTRFNLFDALARDKAIYDVAYALKVKGENGQVGGLVRVPPTWVQPHDMGLLGAQRFTIRGVSGKKEVSRDALVVLDGYSVAADSMGESPIESLRQMLAEEYAAGRMREQTLRNGARVSGYLKRPATTQPWSDTARERFKSSWRSQYSGDGPESGGTPILEDGMEFVPAGQDAKALQYVEVRKLAREEVAAAYFIPPPLIGILDHATFSNIREQHKHLYQDTLGPWLTQFEEQLMAQLFPEFPDTDDLYVEYNLRDKLRGDFAEEATTLQSSTGGPWMTRNEARARQNLPAIDGGDELIVPLNVAEGGQASPTDSTRMRENAIVMLPASKAAALLTKEPARKARTEVTDSERDDAIKALTDFFATQRKQVIRLLEDGGDWWDADAWDDALVDAILPLITALATRKGRAAANDLGFPPDDYDQERTEKFLAAVASSRATWINDTTRNQIEDALADLAEDLTEADAVDHVFDVAEEARSLSAGAALATSVAAFGVREAARQLAPSKATKTWVVTSSNPRASHAAMHGETVPVGQPFSNGMQYPGSIDGDVDEVAGCQCALDVEIP